jgi:hypothetical protein
MSPISLSGFFIQITFVAFAGLEQNPKKSLGFYYCLRETNLYRIPINMLYSLRIYINKNPFYFMLKLKGAELKF